MKKYKSNPIEVHAFQFGLDDFPQWFPFTVTYTDFNNNAFIYVDSPYGLQRVYQNQWVVMLPEGHLVIYSKESFYQHFTAKVDVSIKELVMRSNNAVYRMCRDIDPYDYCIANNVSESMTSLISAAFSFEAEQVPSKRRMLLKYMEGLINYEKQFT
jgi:hypothetical protein